MGTDALVSVVGDARLARYGQTRVEQLETRWSRFRPDSEVSSLNAAAGRPVAVSSDTIRLVRTGCAATALTDGRFDPTVLHAVIANGYDRTFGQLGEHTTTRTAAPSPGAHDIAIDDERQTVQFPRGLGFDPGGIGKGLAADLAADEIIGRGAEGVLVDIGGDITCRGRGPMDGLWVVDVEHPWRDEPLLHLAVRDAGAATSSTLRRRWGPGRSVHHIVDPATGQPTTTSLVSATVFAAEASTAEALATAVIVAGTIDVAGNASVIAVASDGTVHASGELVAAA